MSLLLGLLLYASMASATLRFETTELLEIPSFPAEKSLISEAEMQRIMPVGMGPTDQISPVANRIADNTLRYWAETTGKDTPLVKTARSVEKKMQTGVDFQTTSFTDNATTTNHSLRLNLKAFESIAEIKYSGLTSAEVNYNFRDQISQIKITEKLLFSKEVTVCQEINPLERVSSIGMTWGW